MSGPLYKQVQETLVERIASGILGPGAMLPSEFDLAAELGVSQGTARKAISALEQAGLVERRQGRGTFVTTTTPEAALYHFFRLRRTDGSQAIPEPFDEGIKRRKSKKTERLIFGEDCTELFIITRIRLIDGEKTCHEVVYVPTHLFPGLAERTPLPNALYTLYQQAFGIKIVRADETLSAVIADETIATALDLETGTPVMRVERSAFGIRDNVVEHRVSHYLTNNLAYAISLR